MAIVLESDPRLISVSRALDKVTVAPLSESNDPSFFETLSAALPENIMAAPFIYGLPTQDRPDPGFNTFETVNPDQEFDPEENPFVHIGDLWQFSSQFVGIQGRRSFERVRRNIEISRKNREVLSRSGATGWAALMIIGNADPLLFVPGGILVNSARGIRTARTALIFSAAATAAVSVQEAELQFLDPLRTKGETAFAIGGAAILGGLFGAGLAKLTRVQAKKFAEELAVMPPDVAGRRPTLFGVTGGIDDPLAPGGTLIKVEPNSLIKPEDAVPKLAPSFGVAKMSKWIGPKIQLFSSSSPTVRVVANSLLQAPMKLAKGALNVAPVEAAITALWRTKLSRIEEANMGFYVEYISGGQRVKPSLKEVSLGFRKRDGFMTWPEFDEQFSFALRRIGTPEFKDFPVQVQKGATQIKDKLLDPIADLGLGLGVWTKEEVANPAFLARWYNQDLLRVKAERNAFVQAVAQHNVRVAEAKGETLTLAAAKAKANGIVDSITNRTPTGRSMPDDIGARGSLLARTLDVPDQVIERWLVNRTGDSLRRYVRTVSSDLEIIRKFGLWRARPDLDVRRTDLIDNIVKAKNNSQGVGMLRQANDEFGETWGGRSLARKMRPGTGNLVKAIRKAKTDAERIKLMTDYEDAIVSKFNRADMRLQTDAILEEYKVKAKAAGRVEEDLVAMDEIAKETRAAKKKENKLLRQLDHDLRNLRHMRDDLRGMNTLGGDPTNTTARAFRLARSYTYMVFGGGIALSSLPDAALLINFFGMDNVLRAEFSRLGSGLRTLKLSKADARDMLGASELVNNARARQLYDIDNEFAGTSRLERGTDRAIHAFSIATLIAPWNQGLKDHIAYSTMNFVGRMSREVKAGKAIGKINRSRLDELGLDDATLTRIADQYEKFGFRDEVGNVVHVVPRVDSWEDASAAGMLRISVQQARDKILIYGGTGDRPRIPGLGGELSRSLLMFRNFSLASSTRILGRLAQLRDYRLITWTLTGTTFGMFAIYLKAINAGREPPKDLATWMQQGYEQSGLSGVIFDVDDIIENVSRGKVGISALTGSETKRRFYSGNQLWGSVMGPVGDIGLDAFLLPFNLLDDEVTPRDVGRIRRLIPLQNMLGIRRLWDSLEEKGARAVR